MDTAESPQQGTGEIDENRESTSGTNDTLKYVNGEVDSECYAVYCSCMRTHLSVSCTHVCCLQLLLHLSSLAQVVYIYVKHANTYHHAAKYAVTNIKSQILS